MPKMVESAAREIILRVRDYCEAEKMNQSVIIPLHNIRARVAAMTGVSERTISRIVRERKNNAIIKNGGKKRTRKKKINLNECDFDVIRQRIKEFYELNQELPSVKKLCLMLKDDINFQGSITSLRRILKSMGIKFTRKLRKTPANNSEDLTFKNEITPIDDTPIEDIPLTEHFILPDDQIPTEVSVIDHTPIDVSVIDQTPTEVTIIDQTPTEITIIDETSNEVTIITDEYICT